MISFLFYTSPLFTLPQTQCTASETGLLLALPSGSPSWPPANNSPANLQVIREFGIDRAESFRACRRGTQVPRERIQLNTPSPENVEIHLPAPYFSWWRFTSAQRSTRGVFLFDGFPFSDASRGSLLAGRVLAGCMASFLSMSSCSLCFYSFRFARQVMAVALRSPQIFTRKSHKTWSAFPFPLRSRASSSSFYTLLNRSTLPRVPFRLSFFRSLFYSHS